MDVGTVKNGEGITVILAQSFLKIGFIDIKVDGGVTIVIFDRIVARTAVIKDCKPGQESNKDKKRNFSTQIKPPNGSKTGGYL